MPLPTNGLVAHYEARFESYNNSDDVTSVEDQSEEGHDLTEVPNQEPEFVDDVINGHPVFRGKGDGCRIIRTGVDIQSSELTIAVLVASDQEEDTRTWPFTLHGTGDTGTNQIFAFTEYVDGNGYGVFFRGDSDWQDQDSSTTPDWSLLEVRWDGNSGEFYKDRTLIAGNSIGHDMEINVIGLLGFNGGGDAK